MSSPAPPDRGRGAGRRDWDGNGGPEAGRLQRGSPASPPPHPRAPDPISIPPPPSTCSPLPRPAGQEHKVTDKVKSAVVGAAEKAAPPPSPSTRPPRSNGQPHFPPPAGAADRGNGGGRRLRHKSPTPTLTAAVGRCAPRGRRHSAGAVQNPPHHPFSSSTLSPARSGWSAPGPAAPARPASRRPRRRR